MDDAFLAALRCPLDPKRLGELIRDHQALVCPCGVRFPVKQGLPVLVADEAVLPAGMANTAALPCRKRTKI